MGRRRRWEASLLLKSRPTATTSSAPGKLRRGHIDGSKRKRTPSKKLDREESGTFPSKFTTVTTLSIPVTERSKKKRLSPISSTTDDVAKKDTPVGAGDGEKQGGSEQICGREAVPIGEPVKISEDMKHYKAFTVADKIFRLHDTVMLLRELGFQGREPRVATITDISTKETDCNISLTTQWFYNREEISVHPTEADWEPIDSREIYLTNRSEVVPATSVTCKCLIHFVSWNKKILNEDETSGFLVRSIYDVRLNKVRNLTDEVNDFVPDTTDLSDLIQNVNAPRSDEMKNCTVLARYEAITGDAIRDSWLNKLVDAVQLAHSTEEIASMDCKGHTDAPINAGTALGNNSANGSSFNSALVNEVYEPGTFVPLLFSLELSVHEALSCDMHKYNEKMSQLLLTIENDALLRRRFMTKELDPSDLLAMPCTELKKLEEISTESSALGRNLLKRTNQNWIFLDPYSHAVAEARNDCNLVWTTGATSSGVNFEVSLCIQEAPGISSVVVKSEVPDILAVPMNYSKTTLDVTIMSCNSMALLLQTVCSQLAKPVMSRDYFVLDCSRSPPALHQLPHYSAPPLWNFGLLYHNSYFLVASLEWRSTCCREPYIRFFSSSSNEWTQRLAYICPELNNYMWEIYTVLTFDKKFWWVDLRCGLLSCVAEVTKDQPVINFTPFPDRDMKYANMLTSNDGLPIRDQGIAVSNGCITFVRINRTTSPCDCCGCPGSVTVWTLSNGNWSKDYILNFAELWEHDSYLSNNLPNEVPKYPMVDPSDPCVVHFWLREGAHDRGIQFSVDLQTKVVKSYKNNSKDLNYLKHYYQPFVLEAA